MIKDQKSMIKEQESKTNDQRPETIGASPFDFQEETIRQAGKCAPF